MNTVKKIACFASLRNRLAGRKLFSKLSIHAVYSAKIYLVSQPGTFCIKMRILVKVLALDPENA